MIDMTNEIPFIGRYQELRSLSEFYDHDWRRGGGFMHLYGRKGIGKTRLLKQFLQETGITDAFYWHAPDGNAEIQLHSFSQALLRYDSGMGVLPPPDFSFFDWKAALRHLAEMCEDGDEMKLFIVEGFTELCRNEMGVSSHFKQVWDLRLQFITNLRLIVTGSHVSTIIREVLSYSAPLYQRANAHLYLNPLRYTDLLDLWPARTTEERMAIYAMTGGRPAYLSYFVKEKDIPTAIEAMCFASDSTFLSDMEMLFDEQFEDTALSQHLLMAMADDACDSTNLSKRTGIPYDELQRPLMFLRLLKMVEERTSVHASNTFVNLHHTITEREIRFYYRYLKPALGEQTPAKTAVIAYTDLQKELGLEPFAALCQEWIWAAKRMDILDIGMWRVGSYWNEEIDVPDFPVAIADTDEKIMLVGALFWGDEDVRIADLERFVCDSQQVLQDMEDGWQVKQVVFGKRPFTVGVQETAVNMDVRLVTLAEIEPLLLTGRTQRRWDQDHPRTTEIPF